MSIILRSLYSIDKESIPLIHIESMNSSREYIEREQQIIDILKDDFIIRIRTYSGREYLCSMKDSIARSDPSYKHSQETFYQEIVFEQWLRILYNEIII